MLHFPRCYKNSQRSLTILQKLQSCFWNAGMKLHYFSTYFLRVRGCRIENALLSGPLNSASFQVKSPKSCKVLIKYLRVFQPDKLIGKCRVSQRVSRANSKKSDIILPSTPHIMFSSEWKVLWQKGVKLQPVLLGCGEFLAVASCNVFFLTSATCVQCFDSPSN